MQAYTLRGTRVTRLTTKIVPHSRALHTTPTTAKQQRRQEFFEFNLPPDPTTVRERGVGKFRLQALQQLRGMEVGRESTAVKYGSVAFGLRDPSAPKRESAGFGLRQPARELRQVRGEGDAAEGGEGSESGTAGTISQVSPQELNLNWRAAVRRFRSGENPLDGLHKRKVTPPAGRKRRGTPDLVEPETAAERDERVRTAKDRKTKKRALREIETRDEHLDRSEFNKERRIKVWRPHKKLTYAAMAGVREMHIQDPEYWTPERLSKTYGISYEAVKRVLRSSYRSTEIEDGKDSVVEADGPAPASLARERTQRAAARMARDADSGSDSDIQSKWSNSPSTSNSYSQGKSYSRDDKAAKWGDAPGNRTSPVAAIRRAYGLKRQIEAETSARVAELEREREGENYPRPSRSPPSSRSSRD